MKLGMWAARMTVDTAFGLTATLVAFAALLAFVKVLVLH